MAVTLNANTSTGFIATSDTSGVLQLQTGGTTAVTVNASQNVGIGTSSPAKQLDLAASNTGITTGDPLNTLRFTDTDTTSAAGQPMGRIEWYSSDADTAGVKAYIQAQSTDGSPDADMVFATNHVSGGGTAERMRIQYDGNVGIGTSSPAVKLDVRGNVLKIYDSGSTNANLTVRNSTTGDAAGFTLQQDGVNTLFYNNSNGASVFATNGTEAARITSGANFLVGTTSSLGTNARGQFVQAGAGGAGAAISADATSGTFSYSVAWFAANRSASSAFNFINCTSDQYVTPQFRVQGNGVILAQNTTVQSISDVRTKENIRDSEEGLQIILALQPRRFDFKQGFGNGRKNALGFVAQEIETVFPDAVSEVHLDPDSKDIAYKTVGPGELIPVLVKAIQEQQAIIQTLTDRITALEGTTP
jgi:hypothetical protein